MPMDHDHSYKLLFSHADMVADLLRGFVHEPWVGEIDFASLEKVSGSYVADSELDPLRNVAAALFRMENSRTPHDVEQVLAALVEWLRSPEQASLRRAFTVWLKRVLLPGRMPGVDFDNLNELQEVKSMLAERVIEWTEE